jgi:hypothetical protein
MKEQTIMRLLSTSPLLYRMWRIKDDRTLLDFEKNQKKLKHFYPMIIKSLFSMTESVIQIPYII